MYSSMENHLQHRPWPVRYSAEPVLRRPEDPVLRPEDPVLPATADWLRGPFFASYAPSQLHA